MFPGTDAAMLADEPASDHSEPPGEFHTGSNVAAPAFYAHPSESMARSAYRARRRNTPAKPAA